LSWHSRPKSNTFGPATGSELPTVSSELLPKPIVDRISQEVATAYQNPELAGRLVAVGLDPVATTPEETARIFDADRARWSAVVRANNIKVE